MTASAVAPVGTVEADSVAVNDYESDTKSMTTHCYDDHTDGTRSANEGKAYPKLSTLKIPVPKDHSKVH